MRRVGRGLRRGRWPDTVRLAGVARRRAGIRGGALRPRGLTFKSRAHCDESFLDRRRGSPASSAIAAIWPGSGRAPSAKSALARTANRATKTRPAGARRSERQGCHLSLSSAWPWFHWHSSEDSSSTGTRTSRSRSSAGPWTLRETDRATTGQQRVDRVAFATGGTRLAATCPRYDRLVIYGVEAGGKLNEIRRDSARGAAGRPGHARRPVRRARDARPATRGTSSPAGGRCFDFEGKRKGGRILAGFYPDDLAVTPDGKRLLVLSSGQAEGDAKKPLPALEVIDIESGTQSRAAWWAGSRLIRPTTRAGCRCRPRAAAAAVLLTRTNQTLAIDLSIPEHPRVDRADQAHRLGRSLRLVFSRFRLDHDAGRVAVRGNRDQRAPDRRAHTRRERPDAAASCRLPRLHPAS